VRGDKRQKKNTSNHATPSYDEQHGDSFHDGNISKKLKRLEEQKNKTTYKTLTLQRNEMNRMLINHEQDMDKCIAERLDEQTREHDEELSAVKQSQMATQYIHEP
jgi:hypothetical protein